MLYKWALVIQKLHQHYFGVHTSEHITSRGCGGMECHHSLLASSVQV